MVNLEEIMGENKRFYEPPMMTIKNISFNDIIVTSDPTKKETQGYGTIPGEPSLDDNEDL